MSLHELSSRLHSAADVLTAVSGTIPDLDPGAAALGAGLPGRLGAVGGALHAQVVTALGARSREAATQGARLADLAGALAVAAGRYRATEDMAAERHRPEVAP